MFRHHDRRESSSCKLPKPFRVSKSIVDTQNDVNCCFWWCILAQKYKVKNHGGGSALFKKN